MAGNIEATDKENETTLATFGEHFDELRKRLIFSIIGWAIATVFAFLFGTKLTVFLTAPYHKTIESLGQTALLQSISPSDGFTTYIQIGFIAGLVIASPWILYQMWLFLAAGLYPKEKKFLYLTVPASVALFIAGSLFLILIVAPLIMRFLIMFNTNVLGINSSFSMSRYVSFVAFLMLIFGLGFQLPIVIIFLVRTNIVTIAKLKAARKYVLFGIVVASAVATPPDVVSQLALSLPLYLLFELGLILSKYAMRNES